MLTKLQIELTNYNVEEDMGDVKSMTSTTDGKALVIDVIKNKVVKRFRDGESSWSDANRFASDYLFAHRYDADRVNSDRYSY